MELCRVYQIPHSHFLGGPLRWTDDDQDKALALEELRMLTCRNCGTRQEEWREDPFAYVGDATRCPGCEVIEQEKEQVPEGEKGIQVGLVPREVAEARMRAQAERMAEQARRRAAAESEGTA